MNSSSHPPAAFIQGTVPSRNEDRVSTRPTIIVAAPEQEGRIYSDEIAVSDNAATTMNMEWLSTKEFEDTETNKVKQQQRNSKRLSQKARHSIIYNHVVSHHVSANANWSECRVKASYVTSSSAYDVLVVGVIFVNVLISVRATDTRARNEDLSSFMYICPFFFLAFYSVDFALRLYVTRNQFATDPMNVFDAITVCLDVIAVMFQGIFGDDIPVISVFRGLRMLKILRVIRSLRQFRELYLILQGIAASFKPVLFGSLLIIANLIMWSILAVELLHPKVVEMNEVGSFGSCDSCSYAFSSVSEAMLTFLKTTIGGDSWGEIAVPLIRKHVWAALILIPALISVELGLLNVIAAVLVDRQAQARIEDDKLLGQIKREMQSESCRKLQAVFDELDEDESGTISEEEFFCAYMHNETFRDLLNQSDITELDLKPLFRLIDADRSGEITHQEFIEQLSFLETMNQRTLLLFMRHAQDKMLTQLDKQERKLEVLEAQSHLVMDKVGEVMHKTNVLQKCTESIRSSGQCDAENDASLNMLNEVRECKQDVEETKLVVDGPRTPTLCMSPAATVMVDSNRQARLPFHHTLQIVPECIRRELHGFNSILDDQFTMLNTHLEIQVAAVKEELVRAATSTLPEIAMLHKHAKWESIERTPVQPDPPTKQQENP